MKPDGYLNPEPMAAPDAMHQLNENRPGLRARAFGCLPDNVPHTEACAKASRRTHRRFLIAGLALLVLPAILLTSGLLADAHNTPQPTIRSAYTSAALKWGLGVVGLTTISALLLSYICARVKIIQRHSIRAKTLALKWGLAGIPIGLIAFFLVMAAKLNVPVWSMVVAAFFSQASIELLKAAVSSCIPFVVATAILGVFYSVFSSPHYSFFSHQWIERPSLLRITLQLLGVLAAISVGMTALVAGGVVGFMLLWMPASFG